MSDDRLFAFVSSLCLLLWLLARERRIGAGPRWWMERAAWGLMAGGLLYALFLTAGWLLGG